MNWISKQKGINSQYILPQPAEKKLLPFLIFDAEITQVILKLFSSVKMKVVLFLLSEFMFML